MYKIIVIIFLCFSLQATELEKRNYHLSPFAVDLILHWQDMKNFPYKRHFIWSAEREKAMSLYRGQYPVKTTY